MYNYYKYETQKKKEKEDLLATKDKVDKQSKHLKEKQHKQELVVNHNNRIKDFILKMVNEPQEINNYINPIASTREMLLNEQNEKIIGGRGMVFKSFQTEKERVSEYLKTRETIYNLKKLDVLNIDDNFIDNFKEFKEKTKDNMLVQPFMRYKPRNDLERIFEAINSNSFGRITKKDIEKQIQTMLESKRLEELKKAISEDHEIDFEDLDYQDTITQIKTTPGFKRKINRGEKIRLLRSTMNNLSNMNLIKKNQSSEQKQDKTEARFYLNELHNKTHFKSAAKYSLLFGRFKLFIMQTR